MPLTRRRARHRPPGRAPARRRGPASVAAFADLLADATGTRVIAPDPPRLRRHAATRGAHAPIAGLAEVYAGLLDALGLDDVDRHRQLDRRLDRRRARAAAPARGSPASSSSTPWASRSTGHPVADFFSLTPAQVAERSWYDPSKAPRLDPSALPPAAREVLLGNRAALASYGGAMTDPTLRGRLAGVDVPALVLWGEADRIADPDFGRAFAAAIPGAPLRAAAAAPGTCRSSRPPSSCSTRSPGSSAGSRSPRLSASARPRRRWASSGKSSTPSARAWARRLARDGADDRGDDRDHGDDRRRPRSRS